MALAALLGPSAAYAQESTPEAPADTRGSKVSFALTDTFQLRYWIMPERLTDFPDRQVLNYIEQVNRLTVRANTGRWTAFAQVDEVSLWANQYVLDDVLYAERELLSNSLRSPLRFAYVNPEKLSLTYRGENLTLQIGDFYASFGRGMALNLARNVDIDVDSSIQGARASFQPGAWDVEVLAGQLNRQQVFQDNPNLELAGDIRHWVAGAQAKVYGPATVGAHAVAYGFADDFGLAESAEAIGNGPDVLVGGLDVELYGLGGVDWYVEGDVFGFPTERAFGGAETSPGYALYASAAFYPGPAAVLIEGKRYANTERMNAITVPELYEVAVAPTLEYERQITEDSAATMNSNDLWGGRARVDVPVVPGEIIPYVSVAVFRDLDLGGLHFNDTPETVFHPLVGVELFQGEYALLLNGGYRYDLRDGDAGADRHLHGDVDFKFPLFAGLQADFTAAAEWYRWGVNPFQQADYVESETAVTIQKGSLVSFIWYTDYTTNPLVDTTGNLADPVYGAAEVQVKPLPALTIKAFYGAYKAGIRCSGGQCRLLPGFEGARLTVAGSF